MCRGCCSAQRALSTCTPAGPCMSALRARPCPRCAGGSQSHLWAVQRAEGWRPGALQRAGPRRRGPRRRVCCHLVRAQVERVGPPPARRSNWRRGPLTGAGGAASAGAVVLAGRLARRRRARGARRRSRRRRGARTRRRSGSTSGSGARCRRGATRRTSFWRHSCERLASLCTASRNSSGTPDEG